MNKFGVIMGLLCSGAVSAAVASPVQPAKPKLYFYANRTQIKPGGTATLIWRGVNGTVDYSNFGQISQVGTFKVSPRFTTTYRMQADAYNGSAWGTVTVTVERPHPRIVIVGNPDHPDVPQIQMLFKGKAVVSVGDTIPPNPAGYDVLIIHPSASIGPDDRAAIREALDANKGIVLLGLAPSKLATGVDQFPRHEPVRRLDTTPVAGWFGGVTELVQGTPLMNDEYRANLDMDYFAMPMNVDYTRDVYETTTDWDDPDLGYAPSNRVGVTCYKTISCSNDRTLGFAFNAPSGRVFWQWDYQGRTAKYASEISALFVAGTLWAACP